jgi:putative MATE family efflux protein
MRSPLRRTIHDRDIFRLAIPSLGALIAQPLYIITDTAIVGHLGTEQLAGLALASTVVLGISSILIFLAYGTTGQVGRAIGAGDGTRAASLGAQAMWLGSIVGVVMMVAIWLAGHTVIGWFGAEPAVEGYAWTYLRISAVGLPFILITMAGTGYLRGEQDARTPLYVAVGTAIGNLVVELWFVYGLDMGIAGSAWSTVMAEAAGGIIYAVLVARAVIARGASTRPDFGVIATSARMGVHLVVRTLALRGAFVLAVVIAATMGTTELAAHEIATQIWFLLALALDAIAIAGQALVARHLGAGDTVTARDASRRMVELSVLFGVAVAVVLIAVARPLSGVFSNDTEVVELAAFLMLFVAAVQPIGGHVFALDGILIGAGDLAYLGRAMWVSFLVFAALGGLVLATGVGVGWLWAALLVFTCVRAVTLQHRFRSDVWLVTGA